MILWITVSTVMLALIALALFIPLLFRVVVSTNEVHIVQSTKKTVSYGKDQALGNTYYKWPSFLPRYGIKTTVFPVSIFPVKLENYSAYDKGRVPFIVDIMAFFRIVDSNLAAQRLFSVSELEEQLEGILQGACRTILATSEIEEILEGRGKFGEMFTKEVDANLAQWGVQTVKTIELMDIRDTMSSKVIENIMAKKKSLIEMQSRTEVAENIKKAELAEIEAKQAVKVREQEAIQLIGVRTAEKDKQVGISNELAKQEIKTQERTTAEKDMAVIQVQEVRKADINKEVEIVRAEQDKRTIIIKAEGQRETDVIKAEGQKKQTILISEGLLEQARLNAQAIETEGAAKGAAEQAILIAPVNTQITLAKEIGSNEGYQKYLLGIKEIDKNQVVGVAQAEALKVSDIKIIANTGTVTNGLNDLTEVLSSKGGTQLGAMLEAFIQTPTGEALINKVLKKQ